MKLFSGILMALSFPTGHPTPQTEVNTLSGGNQGNSTTEPPSDHASVTSGGRSMMNLTGHHLASQAKTKLYQFGFKFC